MTCVSPALRIPTARGSAAKCPGACFYVTTMGTGRCRVFSAGRLRLAQRPVECLEQGARGPVHQAAIDRSRIARSARAPQLADRDAAFREPAQGLGEAGEDALRAVVVATQQLFPLEADGMQRQFPLPAAAQHHEIAE